MESGRRDGRIKIYISGHKDCAAVQNEVFVPVQQKAIVRFLMDGTPDEAAIVEILRSQRRLGADIPKIAVTPRSPRDVLTLLSASLTVAEDLAGPHLAISMGTLGASSRAAAEVFGSAATFATAGEGSAPGQLAAEDVARMIALLRP